MAVALIAIAHFGRLFFGSLSQSSFSFMERYLPSSIILLLYHTYAKMSILNHNRHRGSDAEGVLALMLGEKLINRQGTAG